MLRKRFNAEVRPAAVAGRFYDDDPAQLRQAVETCIRGQRPRLTDPAVALMAPHAGYPYSGRIAGSAYRAIADESLDGMLILGPSHFSDFTGAALPSQAFFATPLGEIKVDQEAAQELCDYPMFGVIDSAHNTEHSIEVQLPFLQVALARSPVILPIALGRPPAGGLDTTAEILNDLLAARREQGQRWMIVASSDTYHGYDVAACKENDERLGLLIDRMDPHELTEASIQRRVMACGWVPLALTMMLARKAGANRGHLLERSDSDHEIHSTGGYVVGYIAAVFA